MTYRVEFTEAARLQTLAASSWWRSNRPYAPALFERELAAALETLERAPLSAGVFDEVEGKVVRKARLPKTGYALYFTVDGDVVTVHAAWHGARGGGPPLLLDKHVPVPQRPQLRPHAPRLSLCLDRA